MSLKTPKMVPSATPSGLGDLPRADLETVLVQQGGTVAAMSAALRSSGAMAGTRRRRSA
nr:hypothetical protein GCM10020092_023970 [Actinoplanes digitatis]